jgi:DNA-binding beta-propeller fold protein YncE
LFSKRYLSIAVILLLAGCAGSPTQKSSERIYWPKPPNPPRFVYEASLRSQDNVKAETAEDRFRKALMGDSGEQKRILAKPFDVAARSGVVVVSDTAVQLVHIFDLGRRKLYRFGDGPAGVLKKPLGVALDSQGQIYVADVGEQAVFVYDGVGMFVSRLGGPKVFERPVDVAVSDDGERIYVLDAGGIDSHQHQVVVMDKTGNILQTIGRRGTSEGEFNLPTQIALGSDGRMYVLDAGNFRVQVFSPKGQFERAWGEVGRNFGNLARPRGLAVDSEGNVYVSDAAFRNFQIFNSKGQLLMAIGGEGLLDEPGQYSLPAGMAVDEHNNVYVVDQLFGKVDVIRKLRPEEVEMGRAIENR